MVKEDFDDEPEDGYDDDTHTSNAQKQADLMMVSCLQTTHRAVLTCTRTISDPAPGILSLRMTVDANQ